MTRHIQVLLVGLIAISALEHSSFQARQAEAIDRAARLAKVAPKGTPKATPNVAPSARSSLKATTPSTNSVTPKDKAPQSSEKRLGSPRIGG